MFKNPNDIKISNNASSINPRGVVADSSYLYAITSAPDFRKYDVLSTQQINTTLTVLASPAAITLIATATACIFSSTTSQVDYVDLNTNARTQVTTNATTIFSATAAQQADSTGGTALACRSTSGGLLKATSAGGLTNMTVSALSGLNAKSILAEPSSGIWFVGTNSASIIAVDSSGNLQSTLSIIKTPAVSSPTLLVTGLSFASPYLLAATNTGTLHLFDYRSGLEVDRSLGNVESSSSAFPSLCPAVSGWTLYSRSKSNGVNLQTLDSIYFAHGKIFRQDFVYTEQSQPMLGSWRTNTKGFVWASDSTGFLQIRIYNMNNATPVTVTTESQDPAGTPVTSRIIRIIGNGIGRKGVYSDSTITTGVNSLPAPDDLDYIELSIRTGNKWDIREFTS